MCSALYTSLIEASASADESPPGAVAEERRSQSQIRDRQLEVSSFDPQDRSASAIALSEALCSIDEDNKHTAQIDNLLDIVNNSLERRRAASDFPETEDMTCILEIYADQLLSIETGRNSMKIIHEYLLRTSKVLLNILKGDKNIEDSRVVALKPVPNKSLTHTMFHIGEEAFDRLLINYEDIDWELMFEIPLSVSNERVRTEVLSRPELVNILQLEEEERKAAHFVKQLCTTGTMTRGN